MEILNHAKVICADDQTCGHTTYVILNPVTQKVTHVVVKSGLWPHDDERLVPIELVTESTQDYIRLKCSKDELAKMDSFIETEFMEATVEQYMVDPYVLMWPYRFVETEHIPVASERIPVGELAVQRGVRVEAKDGYAGHVDGFLVDKTSEHITHLVLREGHLWGQKDVLIPVSEIEQIDEDVVRLKLEKDGIGNLLPLSAEK